MASTKCFFPFNNGTNPQKVEKGDKIKLVTGEIFTFMEIKRTKWVGKNEAGQMYNIPITMAKEKTGEVDKNIKVKSEDPRKFNAGQLFAIENAKETFMFQGMKPVRANAKEKVMAVDLATGRGWNIDVNCTFKKIHVNKMREELRNV